MANIFLKISLLELYKQYIDVHRKFRLIKFIEHALLHLEKATLVYVDAKVRVFSKIKHILKGEELKTKKQERESKGILFSSA